MSEPRLPYYQAPEGLRERVSTSLRRAPKTRASKARWPVSARMAASAAVLVLAAAALTWYLGAGGRTMEAELNGVLDAHLRSLVPGHLVDVASTDQHTVKPWFAGKLEFSPPVTDFAAEGFPLVGGRVDVVAGRSVAALVYSRRSHLINVFVRPQAGSGGWRTDGTNRQGINIIGWSANGMHYWILSDVNAQDLSQLRSLISGGAGH